MERRRWTAALVCACSALMMVAASAQANVRVGTSGWEWGNPTPQGNTVRALDFVGARGYATGDFGTVLRTDDGGVTWAGLPSGVSAQLPGTRSSAQAGGAVPTDLAFLDDNTGFVSTTNGQISMTTDGGGSWKAVIDLKRPVRDITMVDAKVGFAVGDGALLLRTTDGGATWKPIDIKATAPIDLASVRCIPGATPEVGPSCLIASKKGDVLVSTTDGGTTFTKITPSTDPIFAADFAVAPRIVGAGSAGAVVISADGGATFTRIGSRLPGSFTRLRSTKAGAAFAAGNDGALARSTDSGVSWSRVDVPTSEALVDVAFASPLLGYALDSDGALFRTSNGGTGWSTLAKRLAV